MVLFNFLKQFERFFFLMIANRISRNPVKKFHPISCKLGEGNELTCLCEGMFWTIVIKESDRHLIPVGNPHFRLVLRPNFQLQGYLYGVIKSAWEIGYEDITLPSQVIITKTEYISRFHDKQRRAV